MTDIRYRHISEKLALIENKHLSLIQDINLLRKEIDIEEDKQKAQQVSKEEIMPPPIPKLKKEPQTIELPTKKPTDLPTVESTDQPTVELTKKPTKKLTEHLTKQPTEHLTKQPTEQQIERPTEHPIEQELIKPEPTHDKTPPSLLRSNNSEKIRREETSREIPSRKRVNTTPPVRQKRRSLEVFIGTNLINKIGIIVTIIGVGIGINYSIEQGLLSPLVRIILGYLVGGGLLLLALKLKKKYKEYSAVLASGAMAILYFITLFAYSIYDFFPLPVAFILMSIMTAGTVILSLKYNMSIISHIGLLGAYGVPFLLSSGSDNALVFFIYIGIVNIAVLIISLKKVWGSLLYSTFGLTWSIFALWVFFNHNGTLDMLSGTFYPALILFFLTFYSIVVLARLKHSSKFAHNLLIMVVTNALIAYSLGYHFINETTEGVSALTIYTGINALIHSAIAIVLYQFNINSRDKALYYLIIALAIGSATLMLPIAFDGAVLTTLWIVEAAILFTVGQLRSIIQYKRYSFVILIVAIISFIGDYISGRYDTDIDIDNPIFNSYFGSMLLFSAILYVIYHVNKNYTFNSDGLKEIEFDKLINYAMKFTGIGVLLALYFTFTCEIHIYWNFIENRAYESQAGGDYYGCRESCMALMRVLILIIGIYQKLFKSNKVTSIAIWTVLGFNLLCISDMYMLSKEHMAIRLFVWIATAIAIYLWKRSIDDSNRKGIIQFDMTLYSILLIALTTELLYFASNILDYSNGWSVWVPILWVVYGILLIAGGIRNKKKYLRLSAIAIIGVTLFKFLIFDIPRASSGAKVILLISIGVMLLIGSFIYTKHREKL